MDTARVGIAASNGAGLRQSPMVQGATEVVGNLAPGLTGVCPYGLGATCPLVEIAKRGMKVRERWELASKVSAVVIGLVLAGVLVAKFG